MELVDLFVDPAHMRRGVGRSLVRSLADAARRGARLRLEVDANPHALAFYRSVGFRGEEVVTVEYGTAVRMWLAVVG